jgi:(p)ppGpp synthase/HD superfamily hydrolase
MEPLEKAILIAVQAHAGAKDKAGAPYIMHPLRVMLRMSTKTERIVAVLHDVVEDSDWTLDALRRRGFSEEVIDAVDHLTRRPKERYMDYVERAAGNSTALRVKMADLKDNMDMTRIKKPTKASLARLKRYDRAMKFLKTLEGTPDPV